MSILDGGLLIGVDTPTVTPDTPDTPVTPVDTPRHVKGQHIATLGFDGIYEHGQLISGWQLVNPIQTWIRFEHENYLGTHHADPVIISGTHQIGHFYYRTSDNQWRGIFQNGGLAWEDWNLRSATGVDMGSDRGAFDSDADASDNLFNPDTLTNWAFFDAHYWVYRGERLFDGTFYIENDAVILPDAVVSSVQLGYLFEMQKDAEVIGSFLLLQGNSGISTTVLKIGTTIVRLNFDDYQVTARIATVDSQPITVDTNDNYTLKIYIAEN